MVICGMLVVKPRRRPERLAYVITPQMRVQRSLIQCLIFVGNLRNILSGRGRAFGLCKESVEKLVIHGPQA
jgi:hypothetical protein